MDQRDKLEEFKRVSQFMRDTLQEVDALLTTPHWLEICCHCLEFEVCTTSSWKIRLCLQCRANSVNGWLIIE